MPKAHAQDWNLARIGLDGVDRDSRFLWAAWPWGNANPIRIDFGDVGNADFIIAHDFHVFAKLGKVLHQVVGKGVVVIDH